MMPTQASSNAAPPTLRSVHLTWAVQTRAPLSVSILPETHWHNLRSQFLRGDFDDGILQILYPICPEHLAPPQIVSGSELGISFRRGHKKCIFVSRVLCRRHDTDDAGKPIDTLILQAPSSIREMQRRLYQRVTLPPEFLMPVKIWQGGTPRTGEASWPICAGRVGNLSLGGLFAHVRADQNPRLTVGEQVGIELAAKPGSRPLYIEAQYRHSVLIPPDRIGLGLQFIGLEKELPGRATINEVADLVREARRIAAESAAEHLYDS